MTYIENCLKSNKCNDFKKSRCKQTLQKASSVCTHVETLQKIDNISFDASIQLFSCWNFAASSIKDLNWERVEQLTSPTTSHEAIKYFTENAGTGIHPCVVVEIFLKWWSERTDREQVDMSFLTPLITTIQNVSSRWYYSVCKDERYKGLMVTLDIPASTAERYMCCIYMGRADTYNRRMRVYHPLLLGRAHANNYRNLKGDGTPVQLENLKCSDNMERYIQSVPAFRYNAAVFPPYEDTKHTIHHWYITTPYKHVSLITDSKQEILDDINNPFDFTLNFVPLPNTLQ